MLWAKFSSPNLVKRSNAHWIRFNKIDVMKILFLNAFIGIFIGSRKCALEHSTRFGLENFAHGVGI